MEISQIPFSPPMGFLKAQSLCPLLFTLYTTPLSTTISKCNVTHHLSAEDTQTYVELDTRNFNSNFTELGNILEVIIRGNCLLVSSNRHDKRMGLHSFCSCCSHRMELPRAIRTQDSINGFRQQLKTYLFRLAYLPR